MLDHAAALLSRMFSIATARSTCSACLVGVIAFGSASLLASSAAALEGIDLSRPAEPVAEGACSRLAAIKYPFLGCGANGEIVSPDADATWENSRRIPLMSDWTEGDGAFGPDLNTDMD